MPPNFLLPESIVKGDGVGPKIDLCHIVEKESLDVSAWGSEDGDIWGTRSLAAFPLKFYCGLYSILLNLAGRPEITFVRGKWEMRRWSKGDTTPMFGFYPDAELSGPRVTAASFQEGQTGHCDRGLESANFWFTRFADPRRRRSGFNENAAVSACFTSSPGKPRLRRRIM
jgi:hypothetical protein